MIVIIVALRRTKRFCYSRGLRAAPQGYSPWTPPYHLPRPTCAHVPASAIADARCADHLGSRSFSGLRGGPTVCRYRVPDHHLHHHASLATRSTLGAAEARGGGYVGTCWPREVIRRGPGRVALV